MSEIASVLPHAIQITGFVMVMMLLVEWLNVKTQGAWQERLAKRPFGQYLLAAFLGATPGCLGAFAVVTLYCHRNISLGALVAAMLATAGDESFVMFAMIPRQAFLLHVVLLGLGIIAGAVTDLVLKRRMSADMVCPGLVIHDVTPEETRLSLSQIRYQWEHCSVSRGVLFTVLALLLIAVLSGELGPKEWNWVRLTIVLATVFAAFVVYTVSDHFLEEHLWKHVAVQHVPRIFMWTFGTLLLAHLLVARLDISGIVQQSGWLMLIIASLVGIIPESGPHLVFVTFYAQGLIPISILLANSIVQDGHGMLPLLAHSRRAFLIVKAINLAMALVIGGIALMLRY